MSNESEQLMGDQHRSSPPTRGGRLRLSLPKPSADGRIVLPILAMMLGYASARMDQTAKGKRGSVFDRVEGLTADLGMERVDGR